MKCVDLQNYFINKALKTIINRVFSSFFFTFYVLLFEKLNDQSTITRLRKIKQECFLAIWLFFWRSHIGSLSVFFKNRIMKFFVFFKKSLFRSDECFNLPVSGKRIVLPVILEWMNGSDNMKRHNRHRRTP